MIIENNLWMEYTRNVEHHEMPKFTNYRQRRRNIEFYRDNNIFNKIIGENCFTVIRFPYRQKRHTQYKIHQTGLEQKAYMMLQLKFCMYRRKIVYCKLKKRNKSHIKGRNIRITADFSINDILQIQKVLPVRPA